MEQLYRLKGANKASFNAANFQLTSADLDPLEYAIIHKTLPSADGFFFGESDSSQSDGDLVLITLVRRALEVGYSVFYWAWW